jgi:hypothetical protein
MYFTAINNQTAITFRLTYWKRIMAGLNQSEEVIIHPKTKINIPTDNCVDEFIIISEDYSRDIFKFRQTPCYDGNRIFPFQSAIDISSIDDTICLT